MADHSTASPFTDSAPAVRTRFAPSPTGMPHIGGLRTVVFSWLLARRHNGQFLLRVEDTDQNRTMPGAVENLLEGLHWMGIDPDEGPVVGGPVGPYYQSERKALYHQYAAQLIAGDHAYRCFCTKERLDAVRAEQMARHMPTTGYDRHCRTLPPEVIKDNLENGLPFVVRLKVPLDGETIVPEALRGLMTFRNSTLEDAVLLKSDGFPTYQLANVIDDHTMGISHVVRGDDWLPSAPLHVLIYQALGWEIPILAHVPNVMGNDNKKLSKRHGAESILFYRDNGFLPEAVINYLAFLGWSYDDKTDILSIAELQRSFGLERVHTAGAIFDLERLRWMNGVYIRALPLEDLVRRALPFMERPAAEGGLPDLIRRPLDRDLLAAVLKLDQERLKTLAEASQMTSFFFEDHLAYPAEWLIGKGLDAAQSLAGIQRALTLLETVEPWEPRMMEDRMRALAEELGQRPGPLFMGVRVAVTGRKETPPLFETMVVLGRARSLARLRHGIDALAALAVTPSAS